MNKILELDNSILNIPEEVNHCKRFCILGTLIITHITSFVLGYYVKQKLYENNHQLICDGSL
tara:strand:- start:183 stop:368 length:186 start_codon:yes stop_codon:yes gene_type:complete